MKRRSIFPLILSSLALVLVLLSDWFPTAYAQSTPSKNFFVWDAHANAKVLYKPNHQFRSVNQAKEGGLGSAHFSVSIDEFYETHHIAVKEALRQFDQFYKQVAMHPDLMGVATNGDEVRALRQQGKIAAILALNSANALESDLSVLRMFHRLGLRSIGLIHWLANNIGDVNYTTQNNGKGYGLTAYGRQLVAEMNRLGIMIDLSHAGEQTILDVIEASKQPVVNTHGGARGMVKKPGNWSDEMIRALTKKGGVLCVAMLPHTVSQAYRDKWHRAGPMRPFRGTSIMAFEPLWVDTEAGMTRQGRYTGPPNKIYEFIAQRAQRHESNKGGLIKERYADIPPLSAVIDHIDYIAKLVGPDHVGIGSDFGSDPINVKGIENAGEYQNIARGLLKKGYSEQDVAKIMGENMLRVFDQITKTAPGNAEQKTN